MSKKLVTILASLHAVAASAHPQHGSGTAATSDAWHFVSDPYHLSLSMAALLAGFILRRWLRRPNAGDNRQR